MPTTFIRPNARNHAFSWIHSFRPITTSSVTKGEELVDVSHLVSGQHEDGLRLRCLEVDDSGNCRHVEFLRSELSTMMGLHPRDLRFLESSKRNLPSILARPRVIIVNLETFKALITADRVLMFDPWYPHVQSVVRPMQLAILSGGEQFEGKPLPFEFIALEHILQTVCDNLEGRYEHFIQALEPILSLDPQTDHSGSALMHLLQLKNGLTSFEVTLRETVGALRDLLETDEDMAGMYLSAKKSGQILSINEHNEIEVILETYLRKVDELENEAEQNVKSITLTEEHVQIRLDSKRNAMMRLDLLCSISMVGLATTATGAALFGMNLWSRMEASPYAFYTCAGILIVLAAGVFRKGLRLARESGINLFQADAKEPPLPPFPHHLSMSHYAQSTPVGAGWDGMGGQAMGIATAKMRRLAKLHGTIPPAAPLPSSLPGSNNKPKQ